MAKYCRIIGVGSLSFGMEVSTIAATNLLSVGVRKMF